jgi:hypothetical protein
MSFKSFLVSCSLIVSSFYFAQQPVAASGLLKEETVASSYTHVKGNKLQPSDRAQFIEAYQDIAQPNFYDDFYKKQFHVLNLSGSYHVVSDLGFSMDNVDIAWNEDDLFGQHMHFNDKGVLVMVQMQRVNPAIRHMVLGCGTRPQSNGGGYPIEQYERSDSSNHYYCEFTHPGTTTLDLDVNKNPTILGKFDHENRKILVRILPQKHYDSIAPEGVGIRGFETFKMAIDFLSPRGKLYSARGGCFEGSIQDLPKYIPYKQYITRGSLVIALENSALVNKYNLTLRSPHSLDVCFLEILEKGALRGLLIDAGYSKEAEALNDDTLAEEGDPTAIARKLKKKREKEIQDLTERVRKQKEREAIYKKKRDTFYSKPKPEMS